MQPTLMRPTLMKGALLALAVLGATLGAPLAVADAGAWTEGVCTDPSGVTVIIDFQELGGDRPFVRCASQPVSSGFTALQQAGIDYTTTVRFPGFVCRIGGLPANDPCQSASPATAYWSYWIAARGGQWCYSNWGAGNRTPPPGSVEGWSFSLNRSASTSPPPRGGVPAALPGTSPGALPGNDCDPSAAAPQPAPQPAQGASPTSPPPPAATSPPSPSAAPGTPGAPDGSGVPIHEQQRETPTETLEAPDAVAGDPGANTTTVAPAVETPTAEVEAEVEAEAVGSGRSGRSVMTGDGETSDDEVGFADEATSSIDLSGDGKDSGTPVGVLIALALVAALGGGSYLIRRRRGATDPS